MCIRDRGMRDNPMAVIITTAGFDKLGPCYQYREMCTEDVYKRQKQGSQKETGLMK